MLNAGQAFWWPTVSWQRLSHLFRTLLRKRKEEGDFNFMDRMLDGWFWTRFVGGSFLPALQLCAGWLQRQLARYGLRRPEAGGRRHRCLDRKRSSTAETSIREVHWDHRQVFTYTAQHRLRASMILRQSLCRRSCRPHPVLSGPCSSHARCDPESPRQPAIQ